MFERDGGFDGTKRFLCAADGHVEPALPPGRDRRFATISLPERVVACTAENGELAVATVQYRITDLAPTVRFLEERHALEGELPNVVGREVSTFGHRFGHFNLFPREPGANLRHVDATPCERFFDARQGDRELPNAARPGTLPLAFSNPIGVEP